MHSFVKGEVDLYIMFYLYTIVYGSYIKERIYSSVDKKIRVKIVL